jgi:serine/threonine protein kinase
MATLPLVGQELAGYRLRAVVNHGGMAVVYEAENPRLGSLVALKILAPELAGDNVFRSRFLQESRVAATLNHPNVIPIYDVGTAGDLLYLAMRYVVGSDLRALLRVQHQLAPDRALSLLSQVARALDAAHRRGLVHRDVKPGNILIEYGAEDDPDHVYLADFGITKHTTSRSGLTATGEFMGTIDYIAPEQIQDKPVDGRTDVYSLGCVLFECLTGRVPFARDVDAAVIWAHVEETPTLPSTLVPGLPPGLDEVIVRAMAKNPADRYPTCREFISAAILAATANAGPAVPESPGAWGSPPSESVGSGSPWDTGIGRERRREPRRMTSPERQDREPELVPAGGGKPRASRPTVPSPRGRRRGWVGMSVAGAAVLLVAAVTGWLVTRGNGPASSVAASSGAANASPGMTPSAPPNHLMQALAVTNKSVTAKGYIPPRTCHPNSATRVTCTHPQFSIGMVTFRTFPTRKALYAAYVAEVKSLRNGQFRTNYGDCTQDTISGEVSWNHQYQHPKRYSLAQSESGMLNDGTQAAGRLFCTLSNSILTIVWTQDSGQMLGSLQGSPHEDAFYWWRGVHHNIDLTGTMNMSGM